MVLATTRADVNGVARSRLDVRKASFAPMDEAVAADRHGVRRDHADRPARRTGRCWSTPRWPRPGRWSSGRACGARSCGCPGRLLAALPASRSSTVSAGERTRHDRRRGGVPSGRPGAGGRRPGTPSGWSPPPPLLGLEIEPELQRSQVEVATDVCGTLSELRAQLVTQRRAALTAAADAGLAVVAAGSLPAALDLDGQPYPKRRYERMIAEYAQVGRQQLVCAMQTQVGVDDRELAVAALPLVGAWLPALLALSASSPYFDAEDTGYASYRTMLWSPWPTAGPPLPFGSAAEYDALVDGLVASGTVSDSAMIYFDVRPSARYPTLEVRVCDAVPLLDDALTLAGLSRALVLTALRSAAGAGSVVHPAATGAGPGRALAGRPLGPGRRAGRPPWRGRPAGPRGRPRAARPRPAGAGRARRPRGRLRRR